MNMDMQALIEEMSALIVKIKNGSATQGELEAFAAAASQLHERAIVLRYKAYEAKVFGTPVVTPIQEEVPVREERMTEAETAPAVETSVEAEEEAPEVSFDLFEEPESDQESFDLFSMDVIDEEVEQTAAAEEEQLTVSEPEPVAEKPSEESIAPAEEPLVSEPHSEVPAEDSMTFEEPLAEMPEEKPVAEQPAVSQSEPVVVSGDIHPVYKRLVTDDNSLAARLMAVRLDSLKGAFGFNERLQIIQELFDGSAEQFTHAIDTLDTLGSKEEARSVVSGFAYRFSWDKESNLALEFVQKVERRYA